jgi:3-oxoacyl-[acyl-carrier-protein] synthase III
MSGTIRSEVIGTGHYLPDKVLTNADLEKMMATSDEWIVQRTGIKQRHIAAEGQTTSDLAFRAAEAAIARAGIRPSEIDLIIVATTTPDNTFPATATKVQARLGLSGCPALDIQAVCSGFIYALTIADNMLRLGQAKTALVIGAETFSRLLDWTDRGTCVLFGDGAGAVLLRATSTGRGDKWDRGVLATHLHADGTQYDMLRTNGGPSSTGAAGHVQMNGPEVFKHAVRRMAEVVDETLASTGIEATEIDWLVPHQANKRIIDGVGQKLGLPESKVVVTVGQHGNTSAASIPLALSVAATDGRIKPGHLILMEAMGAGFTWGAALVRW